MKSAKNIDEYIKAFPKETQVVLQKLRQAARIAAPKAGEAIKYGMPTLVLHGNLVHFAAFKNHFGFFPTPSAIVAFKKELAPYELSKGTIRFPKGQPIPYALVKRIVAFRVKQVMQKLKAAK